MGTDIVYIPRIRKMLTKNPIDLEDKLYRSRVAAKEAIIKATNGKYDFRQIEILKDIDGKPLPKILNENLNINLSLSFDNDYAIAFCITEKK